MDTATFEFRTFADVAEVVERLMTRFPTLWGVRLGVSELMLNAIEHGNLGITFAEKRSLMEADGTEDEIDKRLASPPYNRRCAHITIVREPDQTIVTIADEGQGFDWSAYIDANLGDVLGVNGRGILLSQAVFSSVSYQGQGNVVVATVRHAPEDDSRSF